ncbi:MAG: DUF4390 domain-containing protein [Pseudomonadota bacterium]
MPRKIDLAAATGGLHRLVVRLLALLLVAGYAVAQDDKPGLFEVRSAEALLDGGQYSLDARVQLILSSDARAALDNGIPLNFVTEIEVIESRRFWIDDTIATSDVRYQLQYHALSQRYLIHNLKTGDQQSFATLFSALNNLGRIIDVPIVAESRLRDNRRYRVRIRSLLEFQDFSGPLRFIFFWVDDWHLRSNWFTWALDR